MENISIHVGEGRRFDTMEGQLEADQNNVTTKLSEPCEKKKTARVIYGSLCILGE